MLAQHNERAFEEAIEKHLIEVGGYKKGDPEALDRERCIDPATFISFVKETQPKEWEYLENLQRDAAEETLLEDLCRALNSEHEGCLSVFRHGFKCFGKLFRAAYFAPASGLNPDTQKLYDANRLTITRQYISPWRRTKFTWRHASPGGLRASCLSTEGQGPERATRITPEGIRPNTSGKRCLSGTTSWISWRVLSICR